MRTSQIGRTAVTLLITLILLASFPHPSHVSAQANNFSKIDDFVNAEMQRQHIPGVSVAVVKNGRILLTKGYGLANIEHQVRVKPETIFQSGSMGKQFTAMAVMMLAEAGKLSLSDPITKYFPDPPDSWKSITIRHLLTHTAGTTDYPNDFDFRRDYTEDELLKRAEAIPLAFKPGEKWSYSNLGYVLLGILIHKVSGQFYGDFLQERVFKPLGMSTARIISEADIVPNRAAGYRLVNGELKNQNWVSPSLNTTADGALYLTVYDMAKWDAALYTENLVKRSTLAEAWAPVKLNDGKTHPYGFGWSLGEVRGHHIVEHGGAWQGFKSYIARYVDDQLTVVVFANLSQANPGRIAHGVAGILNPELTPPVAENREANSSNTPTAITGATLLDGSGRATVTNAVVIIKGDSIVAVGRGGQLKIPAGAKVIDAKGLVLAPGFIDTHSHSDRGFDDDPSAATQVSQGITTLAVGQDGGSDFPIGDFLRKLDNKPVAVNVLTFVGHATLRTRAMGQDTQRHATDAEIAQMQTMVEQAMRDGAFGLSTGLEYETGKPATTEEVIALASVAGRFGGIYISHMRDEADKTFESIDELIRIGREARLPAQVSHIKLGSVAVWGRAREAVAKINAARRRGQDVTADCYPYEAWSSTIRVLIPSGRHDDPNDVAKGLADVGGAQNITITSCRAHPDFEFKTLEQIAREQGVTPVEMYMRIVKDGGAGIVCHSMKDEDIRVFYQQPWTMVSSDGGIGSRHPRGAGTFPRVLGLFVRERHWLSLSEAIRKMTSLPAWRLGLKDRGWIKPGYKADLVLFDPATVIDRSTFAQPQLISAGIKTVFVNGVQVWNDGKVTEDRPGRALRHNLK